MATYCRVDRWKAFFSPVFWARVPHIAPLKPPHNAADEYPLSMRQLQARHILLFRILRDHCLFLTRPQIQRIFTLATRGTNKELVWLTSAGYLRRRYRLDTLSHFQVPLYYLGTVGWQTVGSPMDDYKTYRLEVERRSERQLDHVLDVYDVLLKFILEAKVKRIIGAEDRFWQEWFSFGNIPDGWIQFNGTEAFIEVDRGTEMPAVVAQKIDNYIKFKRSGNFGLMFPGCAFRVLFITTTEERIESLERLTRSDDIWFATMDEFLKENLDHQHWFALRGFYALPTSPQEEM
jgi:Replication-relaxation